MNPYERFPIADFTLRDYLALERTIMSNERTLLSYLRTGFAVIIAGVTGVNYFSEPSGQGASLVFAFVGGVITCLGLARFRSIKRRLDTASPGKTADSTAQSLSASED